MNKKQKGHKAETDYANLFKSRDCAVQIAQRTSVFTGKFYVSKDNDFFNLFDILAISTLDVYLVQVKTNVNHVYGALKEIKAFAKKTGNTNITYQVVLKVARKGYVVWSIRVGVFGKIYESKYYLNLAFEEVPSFSYTTKKEK